MRNLDILISGAVIAIAVYLAQAGLERSYLIPPEAVLHEQGYAHVVREDRISWHSAASDSERNARGSAIRVFEDGRELGPAHSVHAEIRSAGAGRFSHWNDRLWFSSSDNTDPRTNGRTYTVAAQWTLQERYAAGFIVLALVVPIVRRLWSNREAVTRSVRLIPGRMRNFAASRDALALLVATVASFVFAYAATETTGVTFWIVLTPALISASSAIAYGYSGVILVATGRRGVTSSALLNIVFLMASIGLSCASLEAYLWMSQSNASPVRTIQSEQNAVSMQDEDRIIAFEPEAREMQASRIGMLTMPEDWKVRAVEVPGAARAYYWQNILHVHDGDNFRRTAPFPDRRPGVMRVMVVGDSFTYGQAVEEQWTYVALLNRVLGESHAIEFLNLGAMGYQSEDVLGVIRKYLPLLKPDLVIYGVCLNDFLPSLVGQDAYDSQSAYAFPIPAAIQQLLLSRVRLAAFVSERYDALLRTLGLRADFYDVILSGFDGMQARFARDAKKMNELTQAADLPPLIAMVFEQNPELGSRGHRLSMIAQQLLRDAGADIVDVEPYFERYHGRQFRATPWDGHPDEEAHAIWADMIARHLVVRSDVSAHRKTE